jgi:hypothetical protein
MKPVDVCLELYLSIAASIPWLASILRFYDTVSNEIAHDEMKKDLADLKRELVDLKGVGFGQPLIRFLSKYENIVTPDDFAFPAETMLIVELISTKSKNGLQWDPCLSFNTLTDYLSDKGMNASERRVISCLKDLENQSLIRWRLKGDPKSDIGPTNSFFFSTDLLFQKWSAIEDTKRIIALSQDKPNRVVICAEVIKKEGWPLRRANATLHFMKSQDLITMPEKASFNPEDQPCYNCFRLTNNDEIWLKRDKR